MPTTTIGHELASPDDLQIATNVLHTAQACKEFISYRHLQNLSAIPPGNSCVLGHGGVHTSQAPIVTLQRSYTRTSYRFPLRTAGQQSVYHNEQALAAGPLLRASAADCIW